MRLIPRGLCELCRRSPWAQIINRGSATSAAVCRTCYVRFAEARMRQRAGWPGYTDWPGCIHWLAMCQGVFVAAEQPQGE